MTRLPLPRYPARTAQTLTGQQLLLLLKGQPGLVQGGARFVLRFMSDCRLEADGLVLAEGGRLIVENLDD